jgi:hypothetical protein
VSARPAPRAATRPSTPLSRALALAAACDREQKKLYELRAARLYALGVFSTYALLLVLVRGDEQRAALANLTHDGISALTFVVGGLSALGAARGFSRVAEWLPFDALASQRGYSALDLRRARLLASAYRCALLVGAPALGLVVVAWACGNRFGWALATGCALGVYVLVLGGSFSLLGWLAARWSQRHARACLLLLALGTAVVALGFPSLPSLPGALSWLLARIAALGEHFA